MAEKIPVAIMFFPNGMAAVFDQFDGQMGKYQGAGQHQEVIAALKADGYDWRTMRVDGWPLKPSQFHDRDGNPIAYPKEPACGR